MKKGRVIATGLLVSMLVLVWAAAEAGEAEKLKRTLKNDMTEVYNVAPEDVDTFTDAFAKGMCYGRLRAHYFDYEWSEETATQKDHTAFGLGGSLIFKTGFLHGIGGTAGLYTSQNPVGAFNENKEDVGFVKSGKDTFDRNQIKDGDTYDGHWGMTSLAQAYLEMKKWDTDVKFGRQIFESFLTASNDTKMIPNTFEGVSLENKTLPETTIKAGFLTRQKLRDHSDFHSVIAVNAWEENDDMGYHAGLTTTRLNERDIRNPRLVVAGITNKGISNLKLDAWYTGVPDLFWSAMGEANYTIEFFDGWSLTPGVRYMEQVDDGAGEIGGAAVNGSVAGQTAAARGYEDADNMDGSVWGARGVLAKGCGSLHAGYTMVSDDADLIAPWRGFPTGGYARSMAQANWEAATESWMIKVDYDFGKAGLIPGFSTAADYVYMDYDDYKEQLGGHSKTDRAIWHIDFLERIPFVPGLEAKIRIGLVDAEDTTGGSDPSYDEWRFEMNYLF